MDRIDLDAHGGLPLSYGSGAAWRATGVALALETGSGQRESECPILPHRLHLACRHALA
jgi:hypothetical protein